MGTIQYLMISQYTCQTIFESSIMDSTCPRTFAHITKWPQKVVVGCDYPIRVHLLRDPEQKRPPRALYIGRDSMARSIAFVEDLQEYTLYDQSYQLLYLITRNALGTLHCTVYRLLNLFPGDNDPLMFDIRYVNSFEMHFLNKVRTNWMEDPYSESVFYATANGNITSIHALPMNRVLSALQDGISGKRVFSYDSSTRSVIRDWDYCLLRDGPLADPVSCSAEREQWMLKEGMYVFNLQRNTAIHVMINIMEVKSFSSDSCKL
uniref:Sema domain-containing protein n=1 Tax=Angiostrongylus cantonensis TaxID=6313 RepID=A0A0K0CV34_ANGCA